MIETAITGRLAVLRLSGEFDVANSTEIRTVIADLASHDVTDITVDLSEVTFLDVTALDALVAANKIVADAAGRLMLLGVSPLIAKLLLVARLDQVLPVFSLDPTDTVPILDGDELAGDELRESFYALSVMLQDEQTLTAGLQRVARAAVVTIPGCDAASIALIALGVPRTAIASNHVAMEVDIAQYRLDEGPCLTAAQAGRRVRVDILGGDDAYGHFAPLAIETGIHATLTAPVILNQHTIGSLNLYSTTPAAFDTEAELASDLLAAQAATAIQHSALYTTVRQLTKNIQDNIDDHAEIAIAQGALSALHDCSLEQARHLLAATAHTNHEQLTQTAQRLISRLTDSPAT